MKNPRVPFQPPPPERRLVLGVIGAPHGVRGEARVKSFTAEPLGLCDFSPLFLEDGRVMEVAGGRLLKDDMLVLRFKGIADRDAIAALTNRQLVVDRAHLPATADEDEFYHADLIGLAARNATGANFGTIIAIHDFGAGDVLEIRPSGGGATWLLPFTKAAVPRIDLGARAAIIDPALLQKPEPPRDPARKPAPARPRSSGSAEKARE
jgi:16S rRNA processing protein RimM